MMIFSRSSNKMINNKQGGDFDIEVESDNAKD
jgi:hypothetical protein